MRIRLLINVSYVQTKKQISQLSNLFSVWESLKYFHPEISTGKHNWDYVAVATISKILNSDNKIAFQTEIDKIFHITEKK